MWRREFAWAIALAAFLSAVYLIGGCATGGTLAIRDGQEQAVDIAWHEVYGRADRPPLVRWKRGADLTCTDDVSGKPGFEILDAADGEIKHVCREGVTWSPLEVIVSDHGETSLGETALAHELYHAVLLRDGNWLPGHSDVGFLDPVDCAGRGLSPDAGRCAIVVRANGAIMAAGR